MSSFGRTELIWRNEKAAATRLAWAFAISVALHLLIGLTYYTGKKLSWWENWHLPAWLKPKKTYEVLQPKPPPPPPSDPPLIFVDVSDAQQTAQPPKDAKYYSDKNSVAANTEADKDTGVPKITGTQSHVPKTEDAPRKQFTPLKPSLPAEPAKEALPEQKAKPKAAPKSLPKEEVAIAKLEPKADPKPDPKIVAPPDPKPDVKPPPDPGKDEETRPRTVQEARMRLAQNQRPSQKMKQDGGVKRRVDISSLDTKATPFGAYDAALVDAITQRWYALLDERNYASDGYGKVVLQFTIHADGRITEMNVAESTVGEVLSLLCKKAVMDPAPFAEFSKEMKRMMGDSRNIQFTFYYN